jgi:RNA polymerase sigma-70 factor (ECF subfamily)
MHQIRWGFKNGLAGGKSARSRPLRSTTASDARPSEGVELTFAGANMGTRTTIEVSRTEETLILAARAGDQAAQSTLFLRYAREARAIAYHLLGPDEEIDDVVQESFAAAISRLSELQDARAFKTWLGAIVSRTTIATIRRRRLLTRLGFVRLEPTEMENVLARDATPDVVAELRAAYGLLASLPAVERRVILLRRVQELTLDEIAERTGLSLATVKRRLALAERRLSETQRPAQVAGRSVPLPAFATQKPPSG